MDNQHWLNFKVMMVHLITFTLSPQVDTHGHLGIENHYQHVKNGETHTKYVTQMLVLIAQHKLTDLLLEGQHLNHQQMIVKDQKLGKLLHHFINQDQK